VHVVSDHTDAILNPIRNCDI